MVVLTTKVKVWDLKNKQNAFYTFSSEDLHLTSGMKFVKTGANVIMSYLTHTNSFL